MTEKMTDEEIDKLLTDLESPVIETDYGQALLGTCALAAQAIRQLRQAEQDAWHAGLDAGRAQK